MNFNWKKGKILKYLKFLSWKRKGWLQFILYFRQCNNQLLFFLFIYKHELIGHLNAPFVRFCNNHPSLCRLPFIPGVIFGIYYFQKWKDAVIIRYTNSKTFVQNYIIMNIIYLYTVRLRYLDGIYYVKYSWEAREINLFVNLSDIP